MDHLTNETLARLIDEAPAIAERRHLERCAECRDELEALREQTAALGLLPALRPPGRSWESLETALHGEGLLRRRRERGAWTLPGPLPHAAAVVALLVAGMGLGAGLAVSGAGAALGVVAGSSAAEPAEVAIVDPTEGIEELSLEEAGRVVELTEGWYHAALVRYGELVEGERRGDDADPLTRYAALEQLLEASRHAVHQAPTDPFLNGLLVNMHAEREATLRGLQVRAVGDNWY